MAALEDVLDKDFVCRFLIEQKHTYGELVTEIKTRYMNVKGCSLRRVKRFVITKKSVKECQFRDGVLDIQPPYRFQ